MISYSSFHIISIMQRINKLVVHPFQTTKSEVLVPRTWLKSPGIQLVPGSRAQASHILGFNRTTG